jgi:hypothetical protein
MLLAHRKDVSTSVSMSLALGRVTARAVERLGYEVRFKVATWRV